ncbi:hypothetical protein N7474_001067 [Penicillium riverlandense]|uniref:uncharacterized protein n=1 Tax=Penicillium riverlandense TaxID=1903569 RepID=UPI002546FF91|nr:uncharacterized protein N7474_001067 [Penicillium riverlandense]KAJ5832756.1 hypothetical protein N7474_001067 [Penicillium riverlandense]
MGASRKPQKEPEPITKRHLSYGIHGSRGQNLALLDYQEDFASDCRPLITKSELLHHFTNVIAADLVWIDDQQNPWRQYICPLASQSPGVLYAALAVAAANLYFKFDFNSPHKALSLDLMNEYRQKTVECLTPYLAFANCNDGRTDSRTSSQTFQKALATALLLWHLEMYFPSDSLWRLHLRTAQALIYHYQKSSTLLLGSDRCGDFLISEFYCATIWPRLTLNVEIDDMTLNIPMVDGTNAFVGFVQLMHQIIMKYRDRGGSDTIPAENAMDLTELESHATKARETVLAVEDIAKINLHNGASCDIAHVVDAWYYAILLFGYRAIGRLNASHPALQRARDCLFESLLSFSSPLSFAQNQPWPLFIAGTECVDNKKMQLWIESRLLSLINFDCPLDRPRMLHFLKEWWAQPSSTSDQKACWMAFRTAPANFVKEFVIW